MLCRYFQDDSNTLESLTPPVLKSGCLGNLRFNAILDFFTHSPGTDGIKMGLGFSKKETDTSLSSSLLEPRNPFAGGRRNSTRNSITRGSDSFRSAQFVAARKVDVKNSAIKVFVSQCWFGVFYCFPRAAWLHPTQLC